MDRYYGRLVKESNGALECDTSPCCSPALRDRKYVTVYVTMYIYLYIHLYQIYAIPTILCIMSLS